MVRTMENGTGRQGHGKRRADRRGSDLISLLEDR